MNMSGHISPQDPAFNSSDVYLEVELLGHVVIFILFEESTILFFM